jgi:hypothetical protein
MNREEKAMRTLTRPGSEAQKSTLGTISRPLAWRRYCGETVRGTSINGCTLSMVES